MTRPLVLKKVSKMFGGVAAVNLVSLDLELGARHAILGPNGAGKTTLFNMISGIFPVTSGRIILFGQDATALSVTRRAEMGLARTFQVTNLFNSLTVFENILLASQAQEPFRFHFHKPLSRYPALLSRVEGILEQWDLKEKRDEQVSSLSYGDQRMIEVVMALANNPKLLLLDEPTAGLSPSETAEMVRFLNGLDESITVLLIEHDMDVVFSLAKTITVMHFGHVIAQGPAERVRTNPKIMEIYLGGTGERNAEG